MINHKFNCNDKSLIYLQTCACCMLQYVGKTVDEFRFRWNNYYMNDRNLLKGQAFMQQHLFERFPSEDRCSFLEDVTITFIDKTDRREHYWRHTLKAMTPLVLNVEAD